ncbi:MAG: radical SAM/SPASM domain-containing protein [Candidatus Omnitrophota bacterium]
MILATLNKYLSAKQKDRILESFPFRCYSRFLMRSHEIRFSCELTTKCNVSCDMCTRADLLNCGQLKITDMNQEMIDLILHEMEMFVKAGRRVYFVPMGLGEPLLYKGLFDLFRRVKGISKDIGVVLVTNAVLLDEAAAQEVVSCGVDEVCVSLNTYDEDSYKRHMKLDAYQRVCQNIENFIRIRDAGGQKRPSLFIQFIDYDNNQALFENEIKRWRRLMSYKDKHYIHPVVNQAGLSGAGGSFKSETGNHPCSQPLWRFAIKVNGDIYPCDPALYSGSNKIESLLLGNIMQDSPIEIFNSSDSKVSKIMTAMRKEDYSKLPECEKCNTYKLGCNCFFELPEFLRFKGFRWI